MSGAEWAIASVGILAAATLMAAGLAIRRSRNTPHRIREPATSFRLRLPRDGQFSPAQAAAWFASLSPLLTREGPPLSLELRGEARELVVLATVPDRQAAALRTQLSVWLPGARLEAAEERADLPVGARVLALRLQRPALYPLRLPGKEEPDPLSGLLGALSGEADRAGLRLTLAPAPADWRRWAPAALDAAEQAHSLPPRGAWFWLWSLRQALAPPAPGSRSATSTNDPADLQEKARAPVFDVRGVLWVAAASNARAEARLRELLGHLQLATRHPAGNTLQAAGAPRVLAAGDEAVAAAPAMALSAGDLAALVHLPPTSQALLGSDPSRQVAAPPSLLPPAGDPGDSLAVLGEALGPGGPVPFGLGPEERRLHMLLLGKTGTGKSTLLASILKQNLERGHGVGLIDPHGDLAEQVLSLVPPERHHQVLYFNPADRDWPVGFNLLASATPADRPLVASGVVGVFKKIYGDSWGPRLEHFLRNAVLAILESPSPSLLVLPRLLTDRPFRQQLLEHVHDPVLRTFFKVEYEGYDPRWRAEAISPILNKVGQFLASPLVRNVVGQSGAGFDLRHLMDKGGIFVANLSSGRIGEDNSALLGGLLVAGFQLAAMSRSERQETDRRDFYLVVDEFQHFANDSFAAILSEARKYRLSLTLSHQYLEQLPDPVLAAVLGNVGSLCVFRVGAGDAARLVKELAPAFDGQDLVHLPNYRFCARITRAGTTLPAFTARTLALPSADRDVSLVVEQSRRRWARPRVEVETEIADRWEGRAD